MHQDESSPAGEPAPSADEEHPSVIAGQARIGLWLFGVYLLLYGGFVGLNAFMPQKMADRGIGGLNLAILYGMALIAAALVLALVYMAACRLIADRHETGVGR